MPQQLPDRVECLHLEGDMTELLKVVVWDLDNTVWAGVAAEGDRVAVRPGVTDLIRDLDRRGVLQSVASRGDADIALRMLDQLDLGDWFVCPRVAWSDKSESIRCIAEELNLRLANFAFIDDDPYERAEVAARLPVVRVYDADVGAIRGELIGLVDPGSEGMVPTRRELYRVEERRRRAESDSGMSGREFLASLGMTMTVRAAVQADLPRLAELTRRTNQLNTTGLVLSESELGAMLADPAYRVLAAEMADRFGGYGTVGLCALRVTDAAWRILLLLTSCRVASRGAGSLLLRVVLRQARQCGVRAECDLIANGRNRLMLVAIRFAGLVDVGPCAEHAKCRVYRLADRADLPPLPGHVTLSCVAPLT